MIVLKFGGASLASSALIKRVASIVLSQMHHDPVVVVSALGDTTDRLIEILGFASRAESYLSWKSQEDLKSYHFCVAEDLLGTDQLESVDGYIRQVFRDLHVRMLEVCEGERAVTPELRDWVLSLGEDLSSRIIVAALRSIGIDASHMDARKLILTDDHFTDAEPQYWETYARIRWALPSAVRSPVVVLGGFIGATEDGRTTTLGRDGSDLTASLVGAALNAEEIQVWKDVDGVLTWDPKIQAGGYRVKRLSYQEMADLAWAGATVLHPDAIAPAKRLRIPVTIRNTFHPEGEGTQIGTAQRNSAGIVKSIACKCKITLLELRSPIESKGLADYSTRLEQFQSKRGAAASLVGMSEQVIYLALDESVRASELTFSPDECVQVHIRSRQAIVTLVGEGITDTSVVERLRAILAPTESLILPNNANSCAIRIAVPVEALLFYLEILRRAFFADVDPEYFAIAGPSADRREHVEETETATAAPWSRGEPGFRGNRKPLSLPGVRA